MYRCKGTRGKGSEFEIVLTSLDYINARDNCLALTRPQT
jgi:hypothetical protein